MSSRAMRRLRGADKLDFPAADSNEEVADTDELEIIEEPQKNRFHMLTTSVAGDDEDVSSNEEQEENGRHDNAQLLKASHLPAAKPKAKKKKKKKNKENLNIQKEMNVQDLESDLWNVEDTLSNVNISSHFTGSNTSKLLEVRALLSVEHRYLNPENEMKKRFGMKVVQGDKSKKRNRRYQRQTWLTRFKDSWPQMTRAGISMRLLDTNRGLQYFAFEHNKDYQQAQFQFLNAVESHDPNNIGEVLNLQPYQLDALIQLSDVFKMSEDMQMAADLIERALYCCECAFHPLFSLTQGNCRLDYRRPENRSFYIALFKHTLFVGNRGCYRTALEFSKLLLSLDPENDPLCILLMIDYYALKSAQYEFLIRMYNEWEAHRNLLQLPNFAFSVPLAKFYLACQLDEDKCEADSMLEDSLLHFPAMLPLLLDKCNIKPDKVVLEHEFFGPRAESSHPEQLRELMNLYVARCHGLWKEPAVMTWLENNVHKVLHRVDHNDERMLDYKEKRLARYRGTPRNILRHIVISELPGVTAALPRDVANSPFMSYDPLPPLDNIASYDRPVQPRRPEQNYGSLSMFFRSLLPNFNAQDLENANRVDELAGAVGGGGLQEHPELRQGFGNLMNALRDLIGQIQPVPPPVENVEDEVDEEDWRD